jgi:hypothetical protein
MDKTDEMAEGHGIPGVTYTSGFADPLRMTSLYAFTVDVVDAVDAQGCPIYAATVSLGGYGVFRLTENPTRSTSGVAMTKEEFGEKAMTRFAQRMGEGLFR